MIGIFVLAYFVTGAIGGAGFALWMGHWCPTWNDLFVSMFYGALFGVGGGVLVIAASPIWLPFVGVAWASEEIGKTRAWRRFERWLNSPICRRATPNT